MAISLVTYDGAELSARDHAMLGQAAVGVGGIIYGCAAAASGLSAVSIADGIGVLYGRIFHITAQTLDVTLPSAAHKGEVYVTIDLSNTETPITLNVRTAASLTPMESDEDFNWADGIAYLPIATFDASSSGVANVVSVNRIGETEQEEETGGNTFHKTWYGIDVDVAVNGKTVCVNFFGNTNQAVTTKNVWLDVADLSSLFTNPRTVEGYAGINSIQLIRYQVTQAGMLRVGYVRNMAGGGAENLAKNYAVKFTFAFSIV